MKLILFLSFGLFFIIDGYAQSAWLQKPNVPAVGRHRGVGFSVGNKGYIGLGHYDNTSGDIILSDIWEYDPTPSLKLWVKHFNQKSIPLLPNNRLSPLLTLPIKPSKAV